jgi:hypothetical protein
MYTSPAPDGVQAQDRIAPAGFPWPAFNPDAMPCCWGREPGAMATGLAAPVTPVKGENQEGMWLHRADILLYIRLVFNSFVRASFALCTQRMTKMGARPFYDQWERLTAGTASNACSSRSTTSDSSPSSSCTDQSEDRCAQWRQILYGYRRGSAVKKGCGQGGGVGMRTLL